MRDKFIPVAAGRYAAETATVTNYDCLIPAAELEKFVGYANPKIQMRYYSGTRDGYGIPLASDDWGGFTYFIEIDDQYVTRQVNHHENGVVVRYDRTHWCDDFGMMFVGRFSHKQKAGRDKTPVTAAEFERIWADALSSPTWSEQIARSREQEWGAWADRVAS